MLRILQDSSLRSALVLAATLGAGLSAQAASITYELDGAEGQGNITPLPPPYSLTVDGVTATLSNLVHDNVGGYLDHVGVSSFNIKFSADVRVTGYNVNFSGQGGGTLDMEQGYDLDSLGNSLSLGAHTVNDGPYTLLANQEGVFTFRMEGFAHLSSITVETSSVPDSNPWAFQAFALFGMVALGHRYGRRSQAA